MQMHIVSKRKDLTLDEAVKTPDGLAVLGFFIEVTVIRMWGLLSITKTQTRTIVPICETIGIKTLS